MNTIIKLNNIILKINTIFGFNSISLINSEYRFEKYLFVLQIFRYVLLELIFIYSFYSTWLYVTVSLNKNVTNFVYILETCLLYYI